MSLRKAFLEALAANEDDTTTRLVYADWLDEHGEHEEADRQRQWPAAKEWLVRFCNQNSGSYEFSYEELLEFGHRVVKVENTSKDVHLDNETLWSALRDHSQEFWKRWSIVTGTPLPPSLEKKGFHYWQCCPGEEYFYFGTPPPNDPDE